MEDLYSVLGCDNKATSTQIREVYQKLCLKYHPDKSSTSEDSSTSKFVQINKAYKILCDDMLRQEYDARWQQRTVAQEWPIQDEVPFQDFEEEDDSSYAYRCRCGGQYELSRTDVGFGVDYVQCVSCSLCVRVIYEDSHDNLLFPT